LSPEELEQTVHFIGSDELFMMSRYKLNINHSEDDQKSADSKDEILIKRDGI